ncbi:hypothetical protein MMC14_009192 [Varicellaria rhodocarpa]|nr:hypothetical protein [Varicellaria rhodocarpa]
MTFAWQAGPAGHYPADAALPEAPPNFAICHESYGARIGLLDCIYALDSLPSNSEPTMYYLDGTSGFSALDGNTMFALPQERRHGTCTITVRLTHPTLSVDYATRMQPASLWRAAAGVVKKCVDDNGRRIGGYTTLEFHNIVDYINDPYRNDPDARLRNPLPPSTFFLTITVTGPGGKTEDPGDYDPMIPLKLYESQRDHKGSLPPSDTNPFSKLYLAMSLELGDLSTTWWNLLPTYVPLATTTSSSSSSADDDKMIYQCDATLGAPAEVDCIHLEYSQFGAPSDTVAVEAHNPKNLSLNTCTLSVSSSTSILLTWGQIGAALNALIGICMTSPLGGSAKGGRALYGTQAFSLQGKTRRKRGKQTVSGELSSLSYLSWSVLKEWGQGLNALPPGVNITLSQHGHKP